ncbi:MAG: hypothetical protein ACD_48C00611G0005 [uncultured bacterium]|nr:MAG: hypothetical protein ACD_48C00611G0005 [uncultured bacterium]
MSEFGPRPDIAGEESEQKKQTAKAWLLANHDKIPLDVMKTLLEGIGVTLLTPIAEQKSEELPAVPSPEKKDLLNPQIQRSLDFFESIKTQILSSDLPPEMKTRFNNSPIDETLKRMEKLTEEEMKDGYLLYGTVEQMVLTLLKFLDARGVHQFLIPNIWEKLKTFVQKEFNTEIIYPERGTPYNNNTFDMAAADYDSDFEKRRDTPILSVEFPGYRYPNSQIVKAQVIVQRG